MLPGTRDITIYRGDTFVLNARLRQKTIDGQAGLPLDLTGATVSAQIRVSTESTGVPLATFTGDLGTDIGTVQLSLTPVQTSTLVPGVYDMQVTFADGTVTTFLKGSVSVIPDVTHA